MRVPLLCYHRVEVPPPGHADDQNFVTPERFAAHIALLAGLGFTGVRVRDLTAWQRGERALPPRAIGITFDDAYGSVADHAIPVLSRHGWPCTVFAVSACIGGTNRWDPDAPRASLLDAAALCDLAVAGHEIGSHSRNHARVARVDDGIATTELTGSRDDLQSLLGAPVESFSYPWGTHDPVSAGLVAAAGYRGAVTLKRWANGRGANPLRLGRMGVGGRAPEWQFGGKLLKMLLMPGRD